MLETLTVNRVGKVQRRTLQGREYLVAPMRMIVPGVLNGSNGPLYYPPEEIRKNVHTWNGMPIVDGHPRDDSGKPVSARSPQVINDYALGYVFNAAVKDNNLDAEAWIDIERANIINSEIVGRLERGENIEISTGLGTTNISANGKHNGRPYTHIARDYQPDHLAVLPSGKGACSVDDGCGLLVNESMEKVVNLYNKADTEMPFSKWLVANADQVAALEQSDTQVETVNSQTSGGSSMALTEKKREELIESLVANCGCGQTVENLQKKSDDELVTILTENASKADKAKEDMKSKKHMEEDEESPEDVEAKNKKSTQNQGPKVKSYEEWMAEAPPEAREAVTNAQRLVEEEKTRLRTIITANERNPFSEDQLKAKSLDDLRGLAALCGPSEQSSTQNAGQGVQNAQQGTQSPQAADIQQYAQNQYPAINFAGAAGGVTPQTQNRGKQVEALGLPGDDYMKAGE